MSGDTNTAFHRAAERMVFGARPVLLAIFGLITVAMLYFAAQLQVDAGFTKQVPRDHEYMLTFLGDCKAFKPGECPEDRDHGYEREFGGTNRVLIALMAKDGEMFDQQFFATLENLTKDVMAIEAIDDSKVSSLFTPNVRFIEVVEDGFAGGNVIPDTFTPNFEGFQATPEHFATIRSNIVKAGILGRLVAKDWSGAMIWADLIPENSGTKLDYQDVARQLEDLRTKYEGEAQTVHIIGFAKMVGDIADGAKSVIYFFAVTIAFTWLLLFLYSTSGKLATLTVAAAIVSVIWMLGALQLMGFGIDPMNMLTPFLIFAIAVSHGEQMINRFRGQIFFGGLEEGTIDELRERAKDAVDPLEAAKRSFRALLIPGTVALVAGCIGFGAILVIPIDMVRELAITATVGVALTVLTDLVLLPLLLSYTHLRNLDRKREFRLRQLTRFDRVWAAMANFGRPIPAAIIILIGVAIWFFAERHGDKVMVGDAQAGVAELRPEARYNQDAVKISSSFSLGVDILNVIAEAGPSACTTSYPAMELVDRFAWHMRNVEGVESVIALPTVAKIVYAGYNEGNIRWRVLPRDNDSLRLGTQGVDTDSGLLNADCSAMAVTMFTSDHKATTIDRVVAAVKEFREKNDAVIANFRIDRDAKVKEAEAKGEMYRTDQVNLRLATGNVGVMAAINDTVRASEHTILYLLYAAVFLMCLLSFRNPLAALCIMLPLVLVTELGHSLMVELGIGMKVNTLCVVALGVGIGVDYGIYIYARMAEAMAQGRTLTESYFIALKTTGIAIFYTALTLAVGVATWIFSELKFQADMGLMLTFMFVVNMVAAIIFLPALCRWLLRPREQDHWKATL